MAALQETEQAPHISYIHEWQKFTVDGIYDNSLQNLKLFYKLQVAGIFFHKNAAAVFRNTNQFTLMYIHIMCIYFVPTV